MEKLIKDVLMSGKKLCIDGCEGGREQLDGLPIRQFTEGPGNLGERDSHSPYCVLGDRCVPLWNSFHEEAYVILLRHQLPLPSYHSHLPRVRTSTLEP